MFSLALIIHTVNHNQHQRNVARNTNGGTESRLAQAAKEDELYPPSLKIYSSMRTKIDKDEHGTHRRQVLPKIS